MNGLRRGAGGLLILALGLALNTAGAGAAESLVEDLARLDPVVAPAGERAALAEELVAYIRNRSRAVGDRHTRAWEQVRSRGEWEDFLTPRLDALRDALGPFPEGSRAVSARLTGTIEGDGFAVENLVFESRAGLWVTANLYRPARADPQAKMPGILICHAHHTPKEHGELQDMGMTWARAGCLVLIMDQLGHGERRQHPFADASSYPRPYRVSRMDYHFRYDNGIQCQLAGESLIGWMVWDLWRGVDLLLDRPGIDPERIILLGAVAGGGDPAAVAAALDTRIAAACPFNFGGPDPQPHYAFVPEQEPVWDFSGGGSWESTRNLRRSAVDGFQPWVIVAATAPRRLVYAHEFAWFRAGDPVWKRLGAVYSWYGAADRLAFTFGAGDVSKRPPEATHCTHIGPVQRVMIHDAFRRWFGIAVTPESEYQNRLRAERLRCLAPELAQPVRPRRLVELLGERADQRVDAARRRRGRQPHEEQAASLRAEWAKLLGGVGPVGAPSARTVGSARLGTVTVERVLLTTEENIVVPLLLLVPGRSATKPAVVVGLSAAGKAGFLRQRAADVAALLEGGAAVCLVDVRGTGETAPGPGRGRTSRATAQSSSLLMLGETQLGGQLRDVRSVLAWLRSRDDLDATRVAVWGDSPTVANGPETNFLVPRDSDDDLPAQAEPLGGLLALLVALYEEPVRAVYARGGLVTFRSVLHGHLALIPHDVVVPGVLAAGDLPDLVAVLAPRPVALVALVDGLNRAIDAPRQAEAYRLAADAYAGRKAEGALAVRAVGPSPGSWFLERLVP
jgi:cephalosporin-C deacetylase-like acetyl esterase